MYIINMDFVFVSESLYSSGGGKIVSLNVTSSLKSDSGKSVCPKNTALLKYDSFVENCQMKAI